MKLPRIIFILLMVLTLSFSMTSCSKTTETKEMSVKEALEIGNGKETVFTGTVYFIDNDGIFVENEGNYVFVNKIENMNVKIKDKVKVTGYYSFFESYSMIASTKSIEVLSSDNTTFNPVDSSIYEIKNTSKNTKDMYSKYVTVKGLLEKDEIGYYIKDLVENKLYIANYSNDELLNKITVGNYVVKKYNDSVGFVLEAGELKESTYSITDLKAIIESELKNKIPTIIYDKINSLSSAISGITYEANFNNQSLNVKSYVQVTKKTDEVITVKALYNDESLEFTYNVTLMPNTAINVSEFLNNKATVNKSNVSLKGIVTAILSSNSTESKVLIVKDLETSDSIMISNNNIQSSVTETFDNIFVGNIITFTAQYIISGTYKNSFTGISKLSSDLKYNEFTIDYDSALVLNDNRSYKEVGLNYEEYYGKLIKFENPYLSMSSSKGTVSKAVLPLYTVDERAVYEAKTYGSYTAVNANASFDSLETYYTKDSSSYTKVNITEFIDGITYYTRSEEYKVFGFNIDNNNLTYGCDSWYTAIDIPSKNYNYVRFDRDIYCYIVPSSKSYIEVIMANSDFYKIYGDTNDEQKYFEMVETSIEKNYYTSGTYYLPYYLNKDTFEYSVPLTISSSDEAIKITKTTSSGSTVYKMVLTASEEYKNATLNIKYSVNGNKFSKDVIINIANSAVINVKDIKELNADSLVYSKGIVVGFSSETNKSTSTTKREFKGVVVKDLVTNDLVIVDGLEYYLGSLYPNFTVSSNELMIGSVIEFRGEYIKNESRVTLRNGGSLTFVEQLSKVDYIEDDIITVHNQIELSNAVYNISSDKETSVNYAKIIKIVGTKANPIYFAPTSSNALKSKGNMNFRVHYNSKASNAADTMVNGYSIAIKQDNQVKNTDGTLWYQEIGLPDIGTSGSMYPGAMAYTGTMYIAIVYNSSSSEGVNSFYYSAVILNWENWSLEELEGFNSSIERE